MRWFDLEIDLVQFFRKLRLKVWFHHSPVGNTRTLTPMDTESSQPELCLKLLGLSVCSDFVPSTTVQTAR